ncbi:MAG: hypothetical protein CMO80_23745 [Verrucomicrobiales bacterium]|nr:hypothetical protein [Verrucomicrobiales bacterium]
MTGGSFIPLQNGASTNLLFRFVATDVLRAHFSQSASETPHVDCYIGLILLSKTAEQIGG